MAQSGKTDKKIRRKKSHGGAFDALKKLESKLARKLSTHTSMKLSANPKKLFSFNIRW